MNSKDLGNSLKVWTELFVTLSCVVLQVGQLRMKQKQQKGVPDRF